MRLNSSACWRLNSKACCGSIVELCEKHSQIIKLTWANPLVPLSAAELEGDELQAVWPGGVWLQAVLCNVQIPHQRPLQADPGRVPRSVPQSLSLFTILPLLVHLQAGQSLWASCNLLTLPLQAGRYGGHCQRHKPTELAYSFLSCFFSLFLSLWPFQLYFIL